jgi:hypothetical protein
MADKQAANPTPPPPLDPALAARVAAGEVQAVWNPFARQWIGWEKADV